MLIIGKGRRGMGGWGYIEIYIQIREIKKWERKGNKERCRERGDF